MHNKITTVVIFLLITTGLQAQRNFKPGYVIDNNLDTIYGEIDYRGDILMSEVCRFKNQDNKIVDYDPSEIFGFRFSNSKYFESKEIDGKNVFLEFLINGKVNIYYLRDNFGGNHYFIEKEGLPIKEIPYEEEIKQIDGTTKLYQSVKHWGILDYYMNDAPEILSSIQSLKQPEHRNLIKLAEKYHHLVCNNEDCIIYEKQVPFIKLGIEPTWGLSRSFQLDSLFNEFGCNLYIWVPRANENLYFKTGVIYNQLNNGIDKLQLYKIPFQIQYIYPARRIQPNISLGYRIWLINYTNRSDFFNVISLDLGLNVKINKTFNLSIGLENDFQDISSIIYQSESLGLMTNSLMLGINIKI